MGNVERLLARRTDKVAVLLNANARNVSDGLKRELENFVPPEDLYYSRCFEDARTIARQVLDKGYHTILTGGGDGTFVGYVNCLFEQAQQPSGATLRGAYKLLPVPAHAVELPASVFSSSALATPSPTTPARAAGGWGWWRTSCARAPARSPSRVRSTCSRTRESAPRSPAWASTLRC